MRELLGCAVLLALLAQPALSHAEGRDPVAADALFREGRAAMKRGDLQTACSKLAKSQELDPAPGTLINLSDCLEKRGKLAGAHHALRDALQSLSANDDRIPLAKKQLEALSKRVPRLTLILARHASTDVMVTIDDRRLEPSSLHEPILLDPGDHTIVTSVSGEKAATHNIHLTEGQSQELVLDAKRDLEPRSEVNTPASGEPRDTGSQRRTIGFVLGAAGVVGIAIGTFEYLKFKNKESEREDVCPSARNCTQEQIELDGDLKDEANRAGRISAVSFVLGGAAIAGGIFLVLQSPANSKTTAIRAVVRGNAGGGGFEIIGGF